MRSSAVKPVVLAPGVRIPGVTIVPGHEKDREDASPERVSFDLRRTVLLAVLIAFPAFWTLRPVDDPDVFFHLAAGRSIVSRGVVPDTDPFSTFGEGKPFVAYSWLFEVAVYAAYRALGYLGVMLVGTALTLALGAVVARLVVRRSPSFTWSALVLAVVMTGLLRLASPRPWLVSMIIFAIELDLLLDARERGVVRRLWLLPPIFALWASSHIQFVHGLVPLGIALLESLLERTSPRAFPHDGPKLEARSLALVLCACLLATLANPYGVGVWETVLEYARATGAYEVVTEHRPLQFRELADWVAPVATIGCGIVLGWRHERRALPYVLLAAGAYFTFRSGRDIWFPLISAAALVAPSSPFGPEETFARRARARAGVFALAVLLLLATGLRRGLDENRIRRAVAASYPVQAAVALVASPERGAVFNDYDWGGFLIFALEGRLVSIDGRTNLHGDDRIERSRATWEGVPGWRDDPDLKAARFVVAPRSKPLAKLLEHDAGWHIIHADDVAIVFVRGP